MHTLRPRGIALLSLLYAVGAALCAVSALAPASDRSPVRLLWALAALGAAGSAVLWLRRDRLGPRSVHAAVFLPSVALGLLAWRSATAVGIVGLGPAMVAMAVFSAHFLSSRAARLHVGLLLALTTAGAVAAAPSGFLPQWLTTVVTVVVLTEAQTRLSGDLLRAAGTDPLTGLANRRAWQVTADRGLAQARRSAEPFTVALIDLDGFKAVNDQAGHGAGDALLQELARAWNAELRMSDLLGRYGGDEFVLSLPATDAARAEDLLARLRAAHPAAWSAGTATAGPGDTLADLLVRADTELYRSKRSRRRT
ncbi:diguanylate cyclase [Geodermatophilus sp. DSM 45219]|uniref:GGDEF domain-containing protein n=1 Tax=Geodermatophilus sp. DSM 45219 TaxID=1881103 RepID=UPI0008906DCF|nr:GGDEF domain-containing protein [Geodermatophilus sp. DSM 45219]SDO44613.1 diguanylate cyclase (GGDEF) domain-containing protein [Geodermatophilus sp. DSM 45219]